MGNADQKGGFARNCLQSSQIIMLSQVVRNGRFGVVCLRRISCVSCDEVVYVFRMLSSTDTSIVILSAVLRRFETTSSGSVSVKL